MSALDDRADDGTGDRPDLRMPLLGATAWAGAILGSTDGVPVPVLVSGLAALVLALLVGVRTRPSRRPLLAGVALVLLAAAVVAGLRAHQVAHNPVSDLGRERAVVSVDGTVTSDPVLLTTGRTDQVMWQLRVSEVRGRGIATSLVTPVLVLTSADATRPALGATVRLRGRLAPADDGDLAAVLVASEEAEVLRAPDLWWRGSAAVRQSLRESVSHMPPAQRALVPALVVGDDSALPDDVETDFRTTGLTHLLAAQDSAELTPTYPVFSGVRKPKDEAMTVGYTRISDDREGEAKGVGRQRKDIAARALSLGWPAVTEWYEDNDITADPRKKQRPQFQRLLADMAAGTVVHVLCYDQDRLVRDMRELEDLVDAVEAGEVQLTSVNGDIDLTTDNGRMVARIKGAVAKSELEKISRRVKDKQRHDAMAGKKHQGRFRTFGYNRDMTPSADEAAWVRDAFRRKAAGESLTAIAGVFNAAGVRTTGGGPWDAAGVSKLIRRPDYVGDVTLNGEVVAQAAFPALVDRAVYDLANANAEAVNNRGRGARVSLLSGFLVCGNCFTKMKQGGNKDGFQYRCPSPRQTQGACGSCTIGGQGTDDYVFNAAWAKEQEQEPPKPDAPVRDFTAEAKTVQGEIEQAQAMHDAGDLALIDLVPILSTLRKRLATIARDEAAAVPTKLGHVALLNDWESWSLSKQRVWLEQYVDYVLVSKAARVGIKGFKPERLTVYFKDGEVRRLTKGVVVVEYPKPESVRCPNDQRPVYAKGLCHNCYKRDWRRKRVSRWGSSKSSNQVDNDGKVV